MINFYKALNEKCAAFSEDMNTYFKENGLDVHLSAYHSMMSIRFRKEHVRNYADARKASGGEYYGKLFHHLLENRIYLPPADLEAFFVSGAHTNKDLQNLSEQFKNFFVS